MTPLDARTVPAQPAPESNGHRRGRPFSIRMEQPQEEKLRRELARLEMLPFSERPRELFGYDAGGSPGARRASFGWFVLWAALEWAAGRGRATGKTAGSSPGKTRRKAKRAGRKPAKRSGRKGGRR